MRIATRRSTLALWQANHVANALREAHPGLDVSLVPMTTEGDRQLARPLFEIGGKGLFLKELERAMLASKADIAVHSMKDVPAELPAGLCITAVLKRLDPRDAFVSNEYADLDDLPTEAIVGTSSLRRQCQLKAYRPDVETESLRGNVESRLKRLDDGDFTAVILASAGLKRLGMADRIRAPIPTNICLPAIGQGVIGVECCEDDTSTRELLAALNHDETAVLITAERAFSNALAADCYLPVAALAEASVTDVSITGRVGMPDGSRLITGTARGPLAESEAAGQSLALDLLNQGAAEILDRLRENPA